MVDLHHGDCVAALREMAAQGIRFHSCVTDPPYGLVSIVKRFGKEGSAPAKSNGPTGVYGRAAKGFMGQTWDGSGVETNPETWGAVYDVLHPGAHMFVFGGTRTWHRIACAVEDAGFEMRDTFMWLYGTGFPKGLNVVHKIVMGATCQSSAHAPPVVQSSKSFHLRSDAGKEPIAVAFARTQRGDLRGLLIQIGKGGVSFVQMDMFPSVLGKAGIDSNTTFSSKPLSDGDLNDTSRFITETENETTIDSKTYNWLIGLLTSETTIHVSETPINGSLWPAITVGKYSIGGGESKKDTPIVTALGNATSNPVARFKGFNVAIKPSWEPVMLFRKPLIGTVAENVLAYGTGAINIDGCRVPAEKTVGWSGGRGGSDDLTQSQGRNYRMAAGEPRPVDGRWPANVLHDGSDEVEAAFAAYGERKSGVAVQRNGGGQKIGVNVYAGSKGLVREDVGYADSGSVSRFFYSPKASRAERGEGNDHPTVKPTGLMEYLVRLVTPPGGTVLDPFAGSGTTGLAARNEGFDACLIEQSERYCGIIRRRLGLDGGLTDAMRRLGAALDGLRETIDG